MKFRVINRRKSSTRYWTPDFQGHSQLVHNRQVCICIIKIIKFTKSSFEKTLYSHSELSDRFWGVSWFSESTEPKEPEPKQSESVDYHKPSQTFFMDCFMDCKKDTQTEVEFHPSKMHFIESVESKRDEENQRKTLEFHKSQQIQFLESMSSKRDYRHEIKMDFHKSQQIQLGHTVLHSGFSRSMSIPTSHHHHHHHRMGGKETRPSVISSSPLHIIECT